MHQTPLLRPSPYLWGDHPHPVIGQSYLYVLLYLYNKYLQYLYNVIYTWPLPLISFKKLYFPQHFLTVDSSWALGIFSLKWQAASLILPVSSDSASKNTFCFLPYFYENIPVQPSQLSVSDLRHLGIVCFYVLRRWCLKIDQQQWTPASPKPFPRGLYSLVPWAAQSLLSSCPQLRFCWHFSSHQ